MPAEGRVSTSDVRRNIGQATPGRSTFLRKVKDIDGYAYHA